MGKRFFALIFFGILLALAVSAAESLPAGSDRVVFVDGIRGADTASGTAEAPFATLLAAETALGEDGGTVVIAGEVTVTERYVSPAASGAVVYTSTYGGVDYRTVGAKLLLSKKLCFAHPTAFESITLELHASNLSLSGGFHGLYIGKDVVTVNATDASDFLYPVLIGGYDSPDGSVTVVDASSTVSVYSGTWTKVYGGNRRNTAADAFSHLTGDIAVVIGGGRFVYNTAVETSGMNACSGRIYLEISGGEFLGHVYGIGRIGAFDETTVWKTDAEYTADVLVRITGGNFTKRFRLAHNDLKTVILSYPPKGDATVEITGGTFADYAVGYGMMGQVVLRYDPKVLSADKIAGFATYTHVTGPAQSAVETVQFINPISNYPDPYVVQKDGYYYYCYSGNGINVAVHGNVPMGMLSTQYRKVFTADMTDIPNAKKEYWAPELHYFDAETVGAENAGWYIYFAADDGDNHNHRMYVLRATDRENPMSDYEMLGKITSPDDRWAIDGTVMVLGGKLYFVWSGWETYNNVAQDIYIAPMSDPWTVSGERTRLSKPEYSWETQGNPDVNEGPQILQNEGSTHIIYSASGSWSRYYCYGALTLVGDDPLNAAHWYKSPSPVFQSGNGVYGTGHGSFVRDMDGNHWMFYHANSSTSVPSGSTWWAERKTYAKPFAFVQKTVGGKTVSYPDFGTPAAYQGVQSIRSRVTDFHAEGAHWFSPFTVSDAGMLRRCYLCKETEDVRDCFASAFTGELYDRITARAGEGAVSLFSRVRAALTDEVRLPADASAAAYAYFALGEFLTPAILRQADGRVVCTLPDRAVEAIVLSAQPLVLYGDVNGDGRVALLDVLQSLRAAVSEAYVCDRAAADANGDFAVDIRDALQILRMILR